MSDVANDELDSTSPLSASRRSTGIGFNLPPGSAKSPSMRRPTVSFARRASATGMRRNKFGSISVARSPQGDANESTIQINQKIPEISGIFFEQSTVLSKEEDTFAPWANEPEPIKVPEKPRILPRRPPPQKKKGFSWKDFLSEEVNLSVVPLAPRTIGVVSFISRWPLLIMILSLILPGVMMYYSVNTQTMFTTDINDFRPIEHPTVQAYTTSVAAITEWSALQERREIVYVERSVPKYRIFIQFSSKGNVWDRQNIGANVTNLMTEESLRFVQQVEQEVFAARHYRILCWTNNQKLGEQRSTFPECVPPSSVTTYFFPGGLKRTENGHVEFSLNGLGTNFQYPPDRVFTTILQNDRFKWFVDPTFSNNNFESSLLRTQVTLGFPVLSDGTEISLNHYNALVDQFIADLVKRIDAISHPNITITIGGDRMIDALVGDVLNESILYAAIGSGIAWVLMCFHMRSIFLGCCAVIHMTLVYVSSFFCYTQLTDNMEMSLITGITVVVTFSFSAHGILVMHETFVHSGIWATTGRKTMWTLEQRLAFVYRKAIGGLFVSSMAAFAAFGCDALSPVPAMKNFSFMMLLNIVFNLYFSLTFFPASISFYQWHFCKRTHPLIRQKRPAYAKYSLQRRPKVVSFLKAEEATKILYDEPTYLQMVEVAAGRKSVIPTAKSIQRDPIKRRMSMMNLSMTALSDSSPTKSTYLSPRMVPLACIFQVNPQLIVPSTGRATVKSACQSYQRRVVAEGGNAIDNVVPASVESGKIINSIATGEVHRHHVKWEYVGRFIGTLRADDFSPFITEQLSNAIRGDTTVWNDRRSYYTEEFEDIGAPRAYDIPEQIVDDSCLDGVVEGKKKRGLTREEKDSKILNVHVLHQGYTKMERFLMNLVAYLIRHARWPISIAGLITVFLMLIFAMQFKEITGDPIVIDQYEAVNNFEEIKDKFAGQGNCDYCGAYQRKKSEFHQFTINALQQCLVGGYGLQMHAVVDECNVCFGNSSCRDCARRPNGGQQLDVCGVCGGYEDCLKCDQRFGVHPQNISCMHCVDAYNTTTGGYNCTQFCDDVSCPPSRGKCNQWTGECDCHHDFTNGFFASDVTKTRGDSPSFCTECLSGFTPSPDSGSGNPCTIECDAQASPGCGCVNGRCTTCPQHAIGPDCSMKNESSCRLGSLESDGSCRCSSDLETTRCYGHVDCNYHGFQQRAFESPTMKKECRCFGQWRGPKCDKCRCFNGGTCDEVTGECRCIGAWGGFDCSVCATTCLQRAQCPHQWEAMHYDEVSCAAVFCNETFIDTDIPCPICDRRNETLCFNQTNVTCHETKCQWDPDTETCNSVWERRMPVETDVNCTGGCVGEYYGPACEHCGGDAFGVPCALNGVLIGCDGVETPVGQNLKLIDSCGVCNGLNVCLGCDSIVGSQLQVDECGSCGGHNECKTGEVETAVVNFVWGLNQATSNKNGTYSLSDQYSPVNFHESTFQEFMVTTCEKLFNRTDIVISSRSTCVWKEFREWIQNTTNAQRFRNDVNATIQFPFVSSDDRDIHYLMYRFAFENNRFSEIGFNSVFPYNKEFRAVWLRIRMTTTLPVSSSSAEHLAMYSDLEEIRREIQSEPDNSGNILHASEHWALAIARQSAVQVVTYSTFCSTLVFVVGTLIMSTQPALTVLGVFTNAAVMISSLFVYYWMSWELGVVEQLAFSMSVAFSSEYSIHLIAGYNEYLTAATCETIPDVAVRFHSMQTALLRIGASILTSIVCSVCVACTIVASPVRLFSRIGVILITSHLMAFLYALLFFCSIVSIWGPVAVRRFTHDRKLIAFGSCVVVAVSFLCIALADQLELNLSAGSIEV